MRRVQLLATPALTLTLLYSGLVRPGLSPRLQSEGAGLRGLPGLEGAGRRRRCWAGEHSSGGTVHTPEKGGDRATSWASHEARALAEGPCWGGPCLAPPGRQGQGSAPLQSPTGLPGGDPPRAPLAVQPRLVSFFPLECSALWLLPPEAEVSQESLRQPDKRGVCVSPCPLYSKWGRCQQIIIGVWGGGARATQSRALLPAQHMGPGGGGAGFGREGAFWQSLRPQVRSCPPRRLASLCVVWVDPQPLVFRN